MHKGANSTETYFPAGTWYNMYNYSTVDASSGPKNVTVQVRLHRTGACRLFAAAWSWRVWNRRQKWRGQQVTMHRRRGHMLADSWLHISWMQMELGLQLRKCWQDAWRLC